MFSRVLEFSPGMRVYVRTGSGPEEFGTDFFYGTVVEQMASRVVVKWDVGEPEPVGVKPDGVSIDYGGPGEKVYEFVSFEEADGLDLVMPFRGI